MFTTEAFIWTTFLKCLIHPSRLYRARCYIFISMIQEAILTLYFKLVMEINCGYGFSSELCHSLLSPEGMFVYK